MLGLVPAGAVADEVVFFEGNRLMCMKIVDRGRRMSNFGSMPVADIPIDSGAVELESGERASRLFERARDEWLVLMANALVGIGTRSIEIGVEYVKERQQFGVPIGSFQAVAHGLADAATAVDGGKLLAREAAWAADEDTARATELACLSCAFNAEAAREASYRSLHYHGGYGFMLEFDIQLYFRRAKSLAGLFAEPAALYARGRGQATLDGPNGGMTMDFRLGEGSDAFRRRGQGLPGRESHRRGAGSRCTRPASITTGTSTAASVEHGMAGPRVAGGVRRPGPRPTRDAGVHGGVPPGRGSHLRGGHDADGGQRHPAHWDRGAEAADPASGSGAGRSSSSSASPSRSRDPTWPPPRPGPCVTATSG